MGIHWLTGCEVRKLLGWHTLVTVVGLAVLLSLGTWQVHRLYWKRDLVNLVRTRLSRPLQRIEDIGNLMPSALQNIEFQKVIAEGVFLNDQALKLQGRTYEGQIGYHLIVPLRLEDNSSILVDRGWLPLKEPAESFLSQALAQKVSIKGYIRLKTESNFVTPENCYGKREIYALDPIETSKSLGIKNLLPFYIVQTEKIGKEPFPAIAKNHISLRNFHLQYAITWYALALLLGIVYILYILRLSGTKDVKHQKSSDTCVSRH